MSLKGDQFSFKQFPFDKCKFGFFCEINSWLHYAWLWEIVVETASCSKAALIRRNFLIQFQKQPCKKYKKNQNFWWNIYSSNILFLSLWHRSAEQDGEDVVVRMRMPRFSPPDAVSYWNSLSVSTSISSLVMIPHDTPLPANSMY